MNNEQLILFDNDCDKYLKIFLFENASSVHTESTNHNDIIQNNRCNEHKNSVNILNILALCLQWHHLSCLEDLPSF